MKSLSNLINDSKRNTITVEIDNDPEWQVMKVRPGVTEIGEAVVIIGEPCNMDGDKSKWDANVKIAKAIGAEINNHVADYKMVVNDIIDEDEEYDGQFCLCASASEGVCSYFYLNNGGVSTIK